MMLAMYYAAEGVATNPYAQFGVSGVFAGVIVWLARYILKDKERQLDQRDVEIIRLRGEAVDLRKTIEAFTGVLSENTQATKTMIAVLDRGAR